MDEVKEPGNFSWVVPGKLGGCAYPRPASTLRWLASNGVHTLVSLTEDKPPGLSEVPQLKHVHLGMVDFTAPTKERVDEFIQLVDDANTRGEAVCVHCAHGNGRTGTFLACYLSLKLGLTGQEAIKEIRRRRPGAIETSGQEEMIGQYYSYLLSTGRLPSKN